MQIGDLEAQSISAPQLGWGYLNRSAERSFVQLLG